MKKAIWLSYDLDVISGDYEGLYRLLDELDAKECGECIAFFNFDVPSEDKIEETLKELIVKYVKITPKDRFYIIFSRYENGIKKVKGKFLIGSRKKNPPWKGYANQEAPVEEEA